MTCLSCHQNNPSRVLKYDSFIFPLGEISHKKKNWGPLVTIKWILWPRNVLPWTNWWLNFTKNEFSDVVCEVCSKLSDNSFKANIEKHQSVLKPMMQLRIFLQRSEYKFQRDEYDKDKIIISLPAQYSMYFPGTNAEVLYILVSIKIRIGDDMDKGHYACDVLDYNT